jgi:hypothetical protein
VQHYKLNVSNAVAQYFWLTFRLSSVGHVSREITPQSKRPGVAEVKHLFHSAAPNFRDVCESAFVAFLFLLSETWAITPEDLHLLTTVFLDRTGDEDLGKLPSLQDGQF